MLRAVTGSDICRGLTGTTAGGTITAFYTVGANNIGTISYTYVLTDNIRHTTIFFFGDNLVATVDRQRTSDTGGEALND